MPVCIFGVLIVAGRATHPRAKEEREGEGLVYQ